MTNFFGQPDNFGIYKPILAEGGYNYYIKVHVTGRILIQRETVAGTEYLYADGGYNIDNVVTNYATLEYKLLSQL